MEEQEQHVAPVSMRPPPTDGEMLDRMRRYGVPDNYAGWSRATWDERFRPFPEILDQWKGDPWALSLFGPPGTGKTLGAAIVFRRSLAHTWPHDASVRWLYLPLALEIVKEGFSTSPESEAYRRAEWIRRTAKTARLVVFDDLGAELGEWGSQQAQTWIEMRHAACLATVVTSNAKDLEALRRTMPRVASRLSEGLRAGCVLELSGKDLRSRLPAGRSPRSGAGEGDFW